MECLMQGSVPTALLAQPALQHARVEGIVLEILQPCNCLSFLGVWLGREGLDRRGPREGEGADAGAGDHH